MKREFRRFAERLVTAVESLTGQVNKISILLDGINTKMSYLVAEKGCTDKKLKRIRTARFHSSRDVDEILVADEGAEPRTELCLSPGNRTAVNTLPADTLARINDGDAHSSNSRRKSYEVDVEEDSDGSVVPSGSVIAMDESYVEEDSDGPDEASESEIEIEEHTPADNEMDDPLYIEELSETSKQMKQEQGSEYCKTLVKQETIDAEEVGIMGLEKSHMDMDPLLHAGQEASAVWPVVPGNINDEPSTSGAGQVQASTSTLAAVVSAGLHEKNVSDERQIEKEDTVEHLKKQLTEQEERREREFLRMKKTQEELLNSIKSMLHSENNSLKDTLVSAVESKISALFRENLINITTNSDIVNTITPVATRSTPSKVVLAEGIEMEGTYFKELQCIQDDHSEWCSLLLRGCFKEPHKMRMKLNKRTVERGMRLFSKTFLSVAKDMYRTWLINQEVEVAGVREARYTVTAVETLVGELPGYLSRRAAEMGGARGLEAELRKGRQQGRSLDEVVESLPPGLKARYHARLQRDPDEPRPKRKYQRRGASESRPHDSAGTSYQTANDYFTATTQNTDISNMHRHSEQYEIIFPNS